MKKYRNLENTEIYKISEKIHQNKNRAKILERWNARFFEIN